MKFSNYNITTMTEGKTLLYNAISGGVLALNSEYAQQYYKLLEEQNFVDAEKDFIDNLEKGLMLLPDEIDEIEMLKAQNRLQRHDNNSLSFTIAPTLECNFRCPYCYEQGRNYNTMSDETVIETIEYINNLAKRREGLGIVWYGGEPLLAVDIIEKITEGIENKEQLSYKSGLVTNGYLLTRDVALRLKACNVTYIQITIDGPPNIHNQRRKLPDGSDTFFVILNNIKEAYDILPITIRVNVDKTNIEEVDDIMKYLDEYGLKGKIGFYLAPVDNINGSCNSSTCFSGIEFSKEQINFYLRNQERGYTLSHIPHCSPAICGAVSSSSFIIDPLGDLYKCWNEIGDTSAKVGNITKRLNMNSNYTKWLNYEFLTNEKCKECKVLPVCFGGCPHKNIVSQKRHCHPAKFNIEDLTKLAYATKKVQNK